MLHRTLTLTVTCLCLTGPALAQDLAWIDRYDGVANQNDYGEAITTDSLGNAIVTGFTFVEVQQNYFVPRFITIKYAPDGTHLWERQWATGSMSAGGTHVVVDGADNVIVAGFANGSHDWAVVKYDTAGTELWSDIYQADSSYLTEPADLAVDAAGNIYLTGDVGNSINPVSMDTLKYDADGNFMWVDHYTGPDHNGAYGIALAVDDLGNVYTAGLTSRDGVGAEAMLVKNDANGVRLWERDYGRVQNAIDHFRDVAVDSAGDIVATGYFGRSNTFDDQDAVTYKFDPAGNVLWSDLYDGPVKDDYTHRILIDSQDNIIVAGASDTTSFNEDALILKYDSAGNFLWEQRYGGAALEDDYTAAIALDSDDGVCIVGYVRPFSFTDYYFTASYSADGLFKWDQQYGGPMNGQSYGWDIAVSADNSVYVTGWSDGGATRNDIATIKYGQGAQQTYQATGFTVLFGAYQSGSIENLHDSDDAYVTIEQRPAFSPLLPLVRLDIEGLANNGAASQMVVTVETASDAIPNTPPQKLLLLDWQVGWEIVDERMTTSSDSTIEVTISVNPERFIEAATFALRMRLDWFDPGNVFLPAWVTRTDLANWAITP